MRTDPHRIADAFAVEQLRNDFAFEESERVRVAEEVGHADQKVAKQQVGFVGISAKQFDVFVQVFDLGHLHAPPDPALKRPLLVAAEIVADLLQQDFKDRFLTLEDFRGGRFLLGRGLHVPRGIVRKTAAHLLGRKHQIDDVGRNRGVGHVRMLRGGTVASLRQREPAALLDAFHAERAVAAASRQDDADGRMFAVFSEGTQENIDRPMLAGRRPLPQPQCPVLDGDDLVGRVAIDVVGLDGLAIDRHCHRHLRAALQDFAKRAFAVARQMRHDNEAKAGVRRNVAEEQLQCLQSTGRSADADDGKFAWGCHRACRQEPHTGVPMISSTQ
jgi:hypothetical protein